MSSSSSDDTASESEPPILNSQFLTYKLIGDNIDKCVRPRHVRSDSQARSLHYFHTYAVRDRINVSHLDDQHSVPLLSDIDVTSVLPTTEDEKALKDLYCIHVARVLKRHMKFFSSLGEDLERHILHEYSSEMSQKSDVVCDKCSYSMHDNYDIKLYIIGSTWDYSKK